MIKTLRIGVQSRKVILVSWRLDFFGLTYKLVLDFQSTVFPFIKFSVPTNFQFSNNFQIILNAFPLQSRVERSSVCYVHLYYARIFKVFCKFFKVFCLRVNKPRSRLLLTARKYNQFHGLLFSYQGQ